MSRPGGTGGLTHIFAELTSQDELCVPLGRSARLRYTCLSVCAKYVALGSNTGGTYIFSRDTLKYLQVVFADTNYVPVDLVSLSPSDQHIGLGLSNGQVAVYELNIERRSKPERVRLTVDHSGHGVTVMTWDSVSSRLFVGDDTGRISVISVPSSKTKTLFSAPSSVIGLVGNSIYQMQFWKEKLLVSTVTHTYLFDTIKHNYSVIGSKARAGEFGSCFFLEPNSQVPVVYCARPGSRMWEVDFEGKVLNTHQFKQLLAVSPVPVVMSRNDAYDFLGDEATPGHSINFLKMFSMGQFIVTWSSKGLYLFDPVTVKVTAWTQSIKGIRDVCVHRNDVYLFLENTTVRRLTVLPVYQLFTVLASRGRWSLLARLLLVADQVNFRPAALKRVKRDLLHNIYCGLEQEGKTQLLEKVKASMEDVSEGSIDSLGSDTQEDFLDSLELKGYTFLPSGMVVRNGVGLGESGFIPRDGSGSGTDTDRDGDWNSSVEGDANKHKESQRTSEQDVIQPNSEASGGDDGEMHSIDLDDSDSVEIRLVGDSSKKNRKENCVSLQSDLESRVRDLSPDLDRLLRETSSDQQSSQIKSEEISSLNEEVKSIHKSHADTSDTMLKELSASDDKASIPEVCVEANLLFDTSHVGQTTFETSGAKSPQESLESSTISETVVHKLSNTMTLEKWCSDNPPTACSEEETPISFTHLSGPQDVTDQDKIEADTPSSDSPIQTSTPLSEKDYCSTNQLTPFEGMANNNESLAADKCLKEDAEVDKSTLTFDQVSSLATRSEDKHELENSLIPQDTVDSDITQEIKGCDKENDKPDRPNQLSIQPGLTRSRSAEVSSEISGRQKTLTRFASVSVSSKADSAIAIPHKPSKKKRKPKAKSTSQSGGEKLTRSSSLGEEDSQVFVKVKRDIDYDTVSLDAVSLSSIDETRKMRRIVSPDSLSLCGVEAECKLPPDSRRLSDSSGLTAKSLSQQHLHLAVPPPANEERRRSEVIPPLADRLAKAQNVTGNCDLVSDQGRNAWLTSSGEHSSPVSPRTSLTAFKDELSSKLKTQTKSLIQSLKDNNILPRSASSSKLDALLADQNQRQSRDFSPCQSPPPAFMSQSYTQEHSGTGIELRSADGGPADANYEEVQAKLKLDTTPLYLIAQDIKGKLLSSSDKLLSPSELRALLEKWVEEMLKTVGRCSLELNAKSTQADQQSNITCTQERIMRELQTVNPEQINGLDGVHAINESQVQKDQNDNGIVAPDIFEIKTGSINEIDSAVPCNTNNLLSSTSPAYEKVLDASLSPLPNGCDSLPNLNSIEECFWSPTPPTSELPSNSHPSPAVDWWTFIHVSCPFTAPPEHLELFQWLTTYCWLCGISGNILSLLAGLDTVKERTAPQHTTEEEDHTESEIHTRVNCGNQSKDLGILHSERSVKAMLETLLTPDFVENYIKLKTQNKHHMPLLRVLEDTLVPPLVPQTHWPEGKSSEFLKYHSFNAKGISSTSSSPFNLSPFSSPSHQGSNSMSVIPNSWDISMDTEDTFTSAAGHNIISNNSIGCGYPEVIDLSHQDPHDQNLDTGQLKNNGYISSRYHNIEKVPSVTKNHAASAHKSEVDMRDSVLCDMQNSEFSIDEELSSSGISSSDSSIDQASTWWLSETLRFDASMALLTRLLFFLLDYNQVKPELWQAKSRETTPILTWASMVMCSQKRGQGDIVSSILADRNMKSAIDYLRSGILPHKSALMGHLLELFRQVPLMTSEFCGELNKLVSPMDLLGLCCLTGRPAVVHLLRYFKQAMLDLTVYHRPAKFTELVQYSEVRYLISQALIPAHFERCSKANSTNVNLAAEVIKVLPLKWLEILLEKIESDQEREDIFWLCSQLKCYEICIQLLTKRNQWKRLLRWIVECDDIRLLQGHESYKEAYRPRDIQEWTFLLSCLREAQNARHCSSPAQGAQPGVDTNIRNTSSTKGNETNLDSMTEAIGVESEQKHSNQFMSLVSEVTNNDTSRYSNSSVMEEQTAVFDQLTCDKNSAETVAESNSNIKSIANLEADHNKPEDTTSKEGNPWSLTWASVGYLLLDHLGGAEAIKLLVHHMTEENDDPGEAWSGLGSKFIQACFTSFLIEGQKDQVSHEMLEKMSVCMWAKKPGFVSPSVHHAYKMERDFLERHVGEETQVQKVFGQVKTLGKTSLRSEDLGSHWGVVTDMTGQCGICNLPLKAIMSLSVQGSIIFPCGHSYHRCCITGSGCPQLH